MKKRVLGMLLAICFVVSLVPATVVSAVTTTCTTYSGQNIEEQNYSRWSSPIQSYLSACADSTLMRVQYGSSMGVLVEYYDTSYNFLSSKIIPEELPIFGAFYETDENYFLLTGQSNTAESADVEVYRITKYDKNWNRLASVGLYDCNTTVPFDAGSARMDVWGNYLLIRTCHKMYKSSDGNNHQANVTIQVDMDSMTITDSYTDVMNTSYGYVSHSFNQFIKVENGKIVSVDHGDAYPRSIVLLNYQTDVTTGKFVPGYSNRCQITNVLTFPGAIGENSTGASVGGFEISDSAYLIAGNSVVQDEENLSRTTRNVFVASVSKSTSEVTMNWLTSYEEGDGTTSTPQMVPIADNRFIVLWSRDRMVYYTEIDGTGSQVGEIYSVAGNLSDCVPTVVNNKLVWYTWNNETMTFYDISLNDLSQTQVTPIENGHQYQNMGITDGYANLVCSQCGDEKQVKVATSFSIYWRQNGSGSYYNAFTYNERVIGQTLDFWIASFTPSDANSEFEVNISDSSVISYEPTNNDGTMGTLTMLAKGTATVSIFPKYNPDAAKTYTIVVDDHVHDYQNTGVIEDGYAILACSKCGAEKRVKVATSIAVWWNENGGSGYYYSAFTNPTEVGNELYYMVNSSPSDADEEVEVIVSDPELISCTATSKRMGYLTMLKAGRTTVTVRSKLNPTVARTYTVTIGNVPEVTSFTANPATTAMEGTAVTLTAAATGGEGTCQYRFEYLDAAGEWKEIQDYSDSATAVWTAVAGATQLRVVVKDEAGTVERSAMDFTVTSALIKLVGHSLTLDGTVGVNFYYTIDDVYLTDEYDAKVIFTCMGNTVEVPLDTSKINEVNGETAYRFQYGVYATRMTENIEAKFVLTKGDETVATIMDDYCVKDYFDTAQQVEDEKLEAMVNAMSTYGHYAQLYFNVNPQYLPDAMLDVNTITVDSLADYAASMTTFESATLHHYGSTLYLDSATALRFYLTETEGLDNVCMAYRVKGSEGEYQYAELGYSELNQKYYGEIPSIAAHHLDDLYEVYFCTKDTHKQLSDVKTYGAMSYAYAALTRETPNEALNQTVQGLKLYGDATKNYFLK